MSPRGGTLPLLYLAAFMKSRPLLLGCTLLVNMLAAEPIPVTVEACTSGYRLVREGETFFVRGAGGTLHLEALAAAGANSVRTWGGAQTESILDEAHRLGLTVVAGLWLTQERQGMDYHDAEAVQAQHERLLAEVLRVKDHPALLAWGVGNELELGGADPAVWDAVGRLAAAIREVDPHHPIMTVTAWVEAHVVAEIRQRAPEVTILGINAYGGVENLPEAVRKAGWEGPYLVTEWGPNGPWETDPTPWGARPEPTSTAVARLRAERHDILLGDPGRCLGGHVFFWGMKDETTSTWFSMFLEDGTPLGSVDAMAEAWGRPIQGLPAPRVEGMTLAGKSPEEGVTLAPGRRVEAQLIGLAAEAEVEIKWVLRRDDHAKGVGGDPEDRPPVKGGPWLGTEPVLCFEAPEGPGEYRLYAVIRSAGKAATANIPFLVEAAPESR